MPIGKRVLPFGRLFSRQKVDEQAGAELCQAQHGLSYLNISLDLANPRQEIFAKPAVDGAGSL